MSGAHNRQSLEDLRQEYKLKAAEERKFSKERRPSDASVSISTRRPSDASSSVQDFPTVEDIHNKENGWVPNPKAEQPQQQQKKSWASVLLPRCVRSQA
jgi:hypothetical protein